MDICELQDHLFNMLCMIDEACQEEGVHWFLDGGTAIGAIREGDFISWDDDADVKVLTEDYQRFKQAIQKHLPDYMRIVEPSELAPAFYDFVIRLIDTRYYLRAQNSKDDYYSNLINHVCIDIKLFSKAPNNRVGQMMYRLYNKVLYGFGMAHRDEIDYGKYSGIQKIQVAILTSIGKFIPASMITKRQWSSMFQRKGRKYTQRFSCCYSVPCMDFFPSSIYQTSVLFPIRDRLFPVPIGYDQELKQIYGDYMTPVRDTTLYPTHLN